jgi:hypothetical protein
MRHLTNIIRQATDQAVPRSNVPPKEPAIGRGSNTIKDHKLEDDAAISKRCIKGMSAQKAVDYPEEIPRIDKWDFVTPGTSAHEFEVLRELQSTFASR